MRWSVLAAALLMLAGCLAPASTPGQPADDTAGEVTRPSADNGREEGDTPTEAEDAPTEAEAVAGAEAEAEAEAEAGVAENGDSNGASDTARPADMADFLPPPAPIPSALRASQATCERGGGRFVPRRHGGIYDCLRSTRDAGQSCTRAGDCEGLCLARSGSCAPFTPLLGCHEVLDAGGGRMTQCIE